MLELKANRRSSVARWLILAAIAFPADGVRADGESGWQIMRRDHGVTLSVREPPGELPTFRGEATLKGSVLHLLAIVLDDARSTEWSKGADKVYRLRTIDARTSVVYSHSRQMWPAEDRDILFKRTVDVLSAGESYYVRMVCAPNETPVKERTIRVQDCETGFSLRKVDAQHTYVVYSVRAHPGGSAPLWMARMLSKNVPMDILTGLAKQVERTEGKYAATIEELAHLK